MFYNFLIQSNLWIFYNTSPKRGRVISLKRKTATGSRHGMTRFRLAPLGSCTFCVSRSVRYRASSSEVMLTNWSTPRRLVQLHYLNTVRFGLMLSYWQIYRYIYPFHFNLEKEIELFPFSILWDDYFFVQYFSLKNICCQWNSKWMLISKFVRWMLIINYINGTHDILYQKWKKKFFKWVIHFFISKLLKALHYEYKKYMYFWIWTSKHC